MFGIGPLELVLIAVVALMLFSPRELPKMLRSVAKFWGSVRATADEFRDTLMNADGVDEIQNMVKGTKEHLRQAEDAARRELMKARMEMRKAQQNLASAARATEDAKRQEQQAAADERVEPAASSDDDEEDFPSPSKAVPARNPAAPIPRPGPPQAAQPVASNAAGSAAPQGDDDKPPPPSGDKGPRSVGQGAA